MKTIENQLQLWALGGGGALCGAWLLGPGVVSRERCTCVVARAQPPGPEPLLWAPRGPWVAGRGAALCAGALLGVRPGARSTIH